MNLYNYIFSVANCIKEREDVKDLIEKYKKIEKLKNNEQYEWFFTIMEGKGAYAFFAPNISIQIINKIYQKCDFNIIPKEICESILNNLDIKEFVDKSTQINEVVLKEAMSLCETKEFKGDVKKVYAYNKLSEKLGYIGFVENLKFLTGKKKELELYFKERSNIIEEGAKIFPINGFNYEFLQKMYNLNISKKSIDSIEKFNLILYMIEKIIYCVIYEQIVHIEKGKIEIINEREMFNIVYKEMIVDDNELFIKDFPILIIEDRFYFVYSKKIELSEKTKITCKCFSCKLEDKKSLLGISIVDTIELFS